MNRMTLQQLAGRFSLHPQKLFLLDGLGAILSAFLLGFVLVKFESSFGIPKPTLSFLALLPGAFAVYDFYCFIKIKENIGFFLKAIAAINIAYCGLSLGCAFYHYQEITYFGWTYILLEISLVIALAKLEFQTAKITIATTRR